MTAQRLWRAGSPRSLAFGSVARRVLVLYQHTAPGPMRSALRQKVRVLEASATRHEIVYWNAGYSVPQAIRRLQVDAVILDNTLLVARWAPEFALRRPTFDWLAEVAALKVAFPQDEYNHAHVLDDWLADLGVDVVCSVFGPEHRELLYPRLAATARFEKCLTGYVDELDVTRHAGVVLPHDRRPLDLAYRAQALTPRFGRLGQLKHSVADAVAPAARAAGLHVDVSTDPRDAVLGDRWFPFVASARAVLGSESGASAVDRRGELVAAERSMLADVPGLTFAEFDAAMPAGWDGLLPGSIGPRHLEAAAARTCQVLVEGAYDGVLEPDVHYLPVRADGSDVDAVVERLADRALVDATATRAYADLVLSGRYGYAALAAQLERVLDDELPAARPGRPAGSLRTAQAAAAIYNAAVVRPPRWAYKAVDRVAPDVIGRLERERVRWYGRLPFGRS
ncbi:MAG TPA: hypothetical protein VGK92_08125 [Gaiellales bacterium]|jgi:hypothetical protein